MMVVEYDDVEHVDEGDLIIVGSDARTSCIKLHSASAFTLACQRQDPQGCCRVTSRMKMIFMKELKGKSTLEDQCRHNRKKTCTLKRANTRRNLISKRWRMY
jgi:hypothetical protein